jgi:hypothetical protein
MNLPINRQVRDGQKHQLEQDAMVRDTLIMQKVNGAHREAFLKRFPGQIEHCMRLTAERLQAILTRKPTDLTDPETWNCSAEEIRDLAMALDKLAHLHHAYPMETANEPNQA